MRQIVAEITGGKKPDVEYECSDKRMFICLMAIGFRPIRIEGEEPLTLIFVFDHNAVDETVNRLLTGDITIVISILNLWAAENVFQMALSQYKMIRARQAQKAAALVA